MDSNSGKRVYIVDDDDALGTWLARSLDGEGFSVRKFSGGEEFFEALPFLRPGCVLSDLRMPGHTGFDVLGSMRTLREKFPIILITAYANTPDVVRAMKLGAADVVEKPFSTESVAAKVRSVHGRFDLETRPELDAGHEELAGIARQRQATLTTREREVMAGVVAGRQNKLIADELGISPRTVEVYRARLMRKMKVRSVAQLVSLALTVSESGEERRATVPSL